MVLLDIGAFEYRNQKWATGHGYIAGKKGKAHFSIAADPPILPQQKNLRRRNYPVICRKMTGADFPVHAAVRWI